MAKRKKTYRRKLPPRHRSGPKKGQFKKAKRSRRGGYKVGGGSRRR